jgi:hypothetical protein
MVRLRGVCRLEACDTAGLETRATTLSMALRSGQGTERLGKEKSRKSKDSFLSLLLRLENENPLLTTFPGI